MTKGARRRPGNFAHCGQSALRALAVSSARPTGRREELVEELEGATGANRAGIEARIKLLDERILQIETDIASTGQLLASRPRHEHPS